MGEFEPIVHGVGIVNLSADSIGGVHSDPEEAIVAAREFFAQGAEWVDIGAAATNPRAQKITAAEEWQRYEPVLRGLLPDFPGRISIDSFHPLIHRRAAALNLGAFIINDVTGMNNPRMRRTATDLYKAGSVNKVIIGHLAPEFGANVQAAHKNANLDSAKTVYSQLMSARAALLLGGIEAADIVLDPDIGFGKTMRLNWELVRFAGQVPAEQAVMIGVSQKRFLTTYKDVGTPLTQDPHYNETMKTSHARNLYANQVAIAAAQPGQHIYLRVHDLSYVPRLPNPPE